MTTVLIATGASGGHLFPALAVAEELREQGATCVFVVGGNKFTSEVKKAKFPLERLPASAFNVGNPLRKLKAVFNLVRGFIKALQLIGKHHPSVVFGTGGYATVALVFAAKVMGVPVVLHEQNVLPGRANKLLARFADKLLLTFEASRPYFKHLKTPLAVMGNPIRRDVREKISEKPQSKKGLNLLITGGSQGSSIVSEVAAHAVTRLDPALLKTLTVHHQVRAADMPHCKALYSQLPLQSYQLEPFIEDMASALQTADVVIARAGTSSLVENALFGKPTIYIPLELADGHQFLNAQVAEEAGAAMIIPQGMASAEVLLPHLTNLLTDADRRSVMAENARHLFSPNAAQNVAALVLDIAQKDVMTQGT